VKPGEVYTIGDAKRFLEETVKYFENRPTGGEDKAHWANVYNARNCRKVIEIIDRIKYRTI
jgi:hypothetical protein